jgi:hypothetical protein
MGKYHRRHGSPRTLARLARDRLRDVSFRGQALETVVRRVSDSRARLGVGLSLLGLMALTGCASATIPGPNAPDHRSSAGQVTVQPTSRPRWQAETVARVPATPSQGFHWPYYLFVPADISTSSPVHLLVEPNNSGRPDDDLAFHDERARSAVSVGYPNRIARALRSPLLVPVFPRPKSKPLTYTHAFDRDTLLLREGTLGRLDLQLLRMIDDARDRLRSLGIATRDRVHMTGFSASGNFVNRFVLLHPRRVRAAATGGVNGIPIIPAPEWQGRRLRFPVGMADVPEFTAVPVDLAAYRTVSQFIYMGDLDRNDTLPFRDAYDEDDAKLTVDVLGDSMPARWQTSRQIYKALNIAAQFATYSGTAHTIRPEMLEDVIRFLRANQASGFRYIQPHAYPIRPYRELDKVTVRAAWWRGDLAIPSDFRSLSAGEGDFVIALAEWLEGQDFRQLDTFRRKAPLRLELRAAARTALRLTDENVVSTVSIGDGSFQGVVLRLSEQQRGVMAVNVPYELRSIATPGSPTAWTVAKCVTIVRPAPKDQ